MTLNRRRLFYLLLIALVARLPLFFSGSWYDENFSLVVSRLPIDQMLAAIAGDVHPPLYYLLGWLTTHAGGGLLALRLPALLLSLVSLALLPTLMDYLWVPVPAQWGALLIFALAPFQIHFGTEARMYALLQFLMLAGTLAVLTRRWLLTFVCVLALAYTHNWGLFYGAALGVLALFNSPREWKKFIPAFGLAALFWLPWGLTLSWQMQAIHGTYWITRVSPGQILYHLHENIWGITLSTVPGLVGTALWMLIGLWSARRNPAAWRLYLLAFLPLALGVIVSLVYQPVLIYRVLIGSAPFLYMLLASPMERIVKGRGYAYLALIVILPLVVMSYRQLYKPGELRGLEWFNSVPAWWGAHLQPGDTIVSSNDGPVIDFRALYPQYKVQLLEQCQPPLGSLTDQSRAAIGYVPVIWDSLPSGRVWVLYSDSALSAQCEREYYQQLFSRGRKISVDPLNNQFIENSLWLVEK